MKDVYIVDYLVQDSIGNDIAANYANLPNTKGAREITRYNVADYPHVRSTNGFQMDYLDGDQLSYKVVTSLTNEIAKRYPIDKDTAILYGSFAIGAGVRDGFNYAFEHQQSRFSPTKLFANNHDLLSSLIANKLKVEGINTSTNGACSSSMFNLHFASMLIQTGQASSAIVGAVDTPLWPTMQYYWQCTSAISTGDGGSCKPFDKSRDGFLQGEGGTLWLICDEETLERHNLTPKAKLLGIASGSKVTSMTAHDKTGEHQIKMINDALKMAKLELKDMAFFNAHATSTEVGDDIEIEAFQKAFGDLDIPIVSFKGYIGHTMSACGLIESAYGIEAVKSGFLHPNYNLHDPLSSDPRIITQGRKINGNVFMKASFGFGGRASVAVIEAL
jgi:3-oxoacyl-[acyl-carrier-protein] synthase II